MKIERKGVLAALAILWAFSVCSAADLPALNGFYYADELSNPLPGAFIALYKGDDNLLVDSTYTRNDGAFTLKAPPAKGKYYIIATKDSYSQKFDFDYDPEAVPPPLMIQHHQPKSWLGTVLGWLWDRVVAFGGLLFGFAVGLLFKMYEDRKKARQIITREMKMIQDSAAEINKNYDELQTIVNAYAQSGSGATAPQKVQEFSTMAIKIGKQADELLKELNTNATLEEAIYTRYKVAGTNNYAALRTAVRNMKKVTETIVTDPEAVINAQNRDEQLQSLRTLHDGNLLNRFG
jgi:hypothetical protein